MVVIPMLSYENGAAAIEWLRRAFGFSEQDRFDDPEGHRWMFSQDIAQ